MGKAIDEEKQFFIVPCPIYYLCVDALITLLASFYMFNIDYCHVKVYYVSLKQYYLEKRRWQSTAYIRITVHLL